MLLKKIFILLLTILSFADRVSAQADIAEILEKVKGFAENQQKILPEYTADTMVVFKINEGTIQGTGRLYFEPLNTYKHDIKEVICFVDGIAQPPKDKEVAKELFELPISPFDIYEIFKTDEYMLEYKDKKNNLYIFCIIPKKGCKEPFNGRIGIDDKEFAIAFTEMETPTLQLGLFSVKTKIKAFFKKIEDKYWLPYKVDTESKTQVLWKKMEVYTHHTYSNFNVYQR